MTDSTYYLVTEKVARKTGNDMSVTYRIADGRFVVNTKFVRTIPLTPTDFVTGIDGLTTVSEGEALRLIAANGYKKGYSNEKSVPTNEFSSSGNLSDAVDAMQESWNNPTVNDNEGNENGESTTTVTEPVEETPEMEYADEDEEAAAMVSNEAPAHDDNLDGDNEVVDTKPKRKK